MERYVMIRAKAMKVSDNETSGGLNGTI